MPDDVLAHPESSGSATDVDVLVLGTGAGGLTAALAAATAGARVGLYEKGERVGGTIPHFARSTAVLAHLDAIAIDDLEDLLDLAWTGRAPKRLVAERDAR